MFSKKGILMTTLLGILLGVGLGSWEVQAQSQVQLSILGTGDLHGNLYGYDYFLNKEINSGMAKIATLVKKVRKEKKNVILVDVGDALQGNLTEIFNNEKIHPMIQAMNELNYDAWTLGNHEFNFGLKYLNQAINDSKATVLAGNIYKGQQRFAKAYQIIEVQGVKIAIIGMITPHVTTWEAGTPENYKGLTFTDPVIETKKVIAELNGKADVLIGVMHLGLEPEYGMKNSGIKAIAEANPELTAIVAGHAHQSLANQKINGVLIVEPGVNGEKVAEIDLKIKKQRQRWVVNAKKSQNYEIKNIKEDPTFLAKFKKYHHRALGEINKVIAKVNGDFLPNREYFPGIPMAQVRDTALIELINKIQLYYTKADLSATALFNNQADLNSGSFKIKDLANIYPHPHTLVAVKTTGKQLKNYMEWSAKFYNQAKPGDITVSFNSNMPGYNYDMFDGLNYELNVAAPEGKRIENLSFKGRPVTDEMTFTLAMSNYRFENLIKIGYFKASDKVYDSTEKNSGQSEIRELIINYLRQIEKVTPGVDENWKLTGVEFDHPLKDEVLESVKAGKIKQNYVNGAALNVYQLSNKGVLPYQIIDILSISDLHGSLVKNGKNVGIAALVNEVKQIKKVNQNTIFVAAGDLFQGSAESNLLYGKPVAKILKEAGLVASAVGNHEFDWSMKRIPDWAKDGGFDFLAANIYDEKKNRPAKFVKPYQIINLSGIKVALIGLTTPETFYKTKFENVNGLMFKNPVEILPQYVDEVRKKGADFVIALTHLGANQEKNGVITGEAAEIAKVPGLDAIIASHTHLSIAGKVGKVPLIMPYYNGRALGKISLIVAKGTKKLKELKFSVDHLYLHPGSVIEDEKSKKILDQFLVKVGPVLSEKIGVAQINLMHDSRGPSLMGEWVCNIMREKTGAQIALQNGGGLRVSLGKGDLTVGNMYSLMPFDNTLVTAKLTGLQIREAIENGLGNERISFGQVTGVYLTYDLARPFGQRIIKITLEDGTPLENDRYYSVVANDFMFDGGDNYNILQHGREIKNTGIPVRDVIIDYIKNKKTINPVYKGNQKPVNQEKAA